MEFDVDLKEVSSTPLSYYADTEGGARRARNSHGLVGLSYLADGSIVVTTHVGYLYRITPADRGAAKVQAFGWLRWRFLCKFAVPRRRQSVFDRGRYDSRSGPAMVVYDLLTRQSHVQAFTGYDTRDTLLYGSSTRDDIGRFYVVGTQKNDPRPYKPILLKFRCVELVRLQKKFESAPLRSIRTGTLCRVFAAIPVKSTLGLDAEDRAHRARNFVDECVKYRVLSEPHHLGLMIGDHGMHPWASWPATQCIF